MKVQAQGVDRRSAIRLLTLADAMEAAKVISQAFMDDPLCVFMLPNQHTRLATLQKFFRLYAELHIRNQCGFGIGEPLQGAAFWLEPGKTSISLTPGLLRLFLPLLITSYSIGYFRARSIIKQTDIMHQRFAPGPHFYLDNIGVLPASRGQGYSSGLIRPFLIKAEAKGVAAYTDTVTLSNVSLYEHFGFRCMEHWLLLERVSPFGHCSSRPLE